MREFKLTHKQVAVLIASTEGKWYCVGNDEVEIKEIIEPLEYHGLIEITVIQGQYHFMAISQTELIT